MERFLEAPQGHQYIGMAAVSTRRFREMGDVVALVLLGFLEPAELREEEAAIVQRVLERRIDRESRVVMGEGSIVLSQVFVA